MNLKYEEKPDEINHTKREFARGDWVRAVRIDEEFVIYLIKFQAMNEESMDKLKSVAQAVEDAITAVLGERAPMTYKAIPATRHEPRREGSQEGEG